jgi:hypothetical protein
MKHRTPSKPESYLNPQKGICKWCGKNIYRAPDVINKRAFWHKSCLFEYKMIFWPNFTRTRVYMRDKGLCANCGKTKKKWHVDHILPLIDSQGDMKFWLLENLQILCVKCHKIKTKIESKERALKRKL